MFRQILMHAFCNIHESSEWSLVEFYTICCRKAPNCWTFLHPSLLTAKNRVKTAFSFSSTCFVIVSKLHQANVHFYIQFKWFQLTCNQCSAVQHWQVCSLRNRQISTALLTTPSLLVNKKAKQQTKISMNTDMYLSAERKQGCPHQICKPPFAAHKTKL